MATKHFFISYNHADTSWAEWIAATLSDHGYSVVLQAWDFRPGQNFVLEMQRATSQAERTLAVLSANFLASDMTAAEWAAAFAQDPAGKRRKLIPVRVAPCQPEGLLGPIIYIDLVGKDEDAARACLLSGLAESGRPRQAPRFPGTAPSPEPATTSAPFPGNRPGGAGTAPVAPPHPLSSSRTSELRGMLQPPLGDEVVTRTRPTKILFLTANPSDTAALQLDEELRLIGQRIRRGEYRKLFEIRLAPAFRATDLPYELMDNAPDIVHFSGHGSAAGELFFVRDGDRSASPIPAKTLARVFKQFRDRIRCVVLNACFSAIQAEAIAESIPCVVGMSRQVPDSTAIAFAAGFYEALAFGKSVSAAFELGLTQVELADPSRGDTAEIPTLLVRSGEDASRIHFISSAESRLGNQSL